MRTGTAAATVLVLLAVSSGASADVGEHLGKTITSVAYSVEGRPSTDDRLPALVETRVGDPLSTMAVRETLHHLVVLGLFEDAVVYAEPSVGGVSLVYELVPAHPVGDMVFVGAPDLSEISADRLRDAVTERYGAAPPVARREDIALFVEAQLQQRGYLRARVTPRTDVDHGRERATLVFSIEPGQRTRIGQVLIVGTPGLSETEVMKQLEVAPGGWYAPARLAERIDAYLEGRRERGYYQARLTVTTRFSEEDEVADLNVTLVQGPRVIVTCAGDPLMSPDRCAELVPVAREGATDEDLLEDSRNRIESALRAEGYLDATAAYQRDESNDQLTIRFDVERGSQYHVTAVNLTPDLSLPVVELLGGLRVVAGAALSAADLDADVGDIEELYRRRGFAAAEVETSVTPADGGTAGLSLTEVAVDVRVVENAQTIVASVHMEGNSSVQESELLSAAGVQPGQPLSVAQMAVDRDAIERRYADLGYTNVSVVSDPGLSEDGTRADIVFRILEGQRILVKHLLVVGNTRSRSETILREVQLRPGGPLGLADLVESQRRLASLGLFRRSRITELSHGDETTRDVVVAVEESPVTTIGYGGGLEVGQRINEEASGAAAAKVEFAPRGFFEFSRRNLFGKNRSLTLYTGISLRQDAATRSADPAAAEPGSSGLGFNEYRILGTFREPRVAGTDGDAFLTGTIEQQIRSSFNFARRALGAEVAGIQRSLRVSGSYQLQRTEIFDERFNADEALLVDRLFPQVRLSSFSGTVIRDTRDDQLSPTGGGYLSLNGQLAARMIGSEVGFAKSYLTAQGFNVIPGTRRIVFAGSARLGLASGFPREVQRTDGTGSTVVDSEGQPVIDVVEDLPASERFFAGGDTTVRGFALDQLGTQETIDTDGFPIGGSALLIFNAEVRLPLFRGLGVVGFVDAGNVFARTSDIDLTRLRSSVGFGLRYNSPVGPIRLDLGIKTNRPHVVSGQPEKLTAWHVSLGQAF